MDSLEIFNSGSPMVMPSAETFSKSEGTKSNLGNVVDVITKPKVDKLIVPEGTDVPFKNFIFDLRGLDSWSLYERNSLKTLVSKGGDTSLYIITKKEGLRYFGKGIEEHLDVVLSYIKELVFQNKINIYKDFKAGTEPIEIDSVERMNFRLNL